MFLKWCWKG